MARAPVVCALLVGSLGLAPRAFAAEPRVVAQYSPTSPSSPMSPMSPTSPMSPMSPTAPPFPSSPDAKPAGPRAGEPTRASQPALRGDEATMRTGEPPIRLERVESENRPPPGVRFPTVLGGVGLTAAWWGLGVVSSSAFSDDPGMKDLRTPVAGPWLALSNNRCVEDCSLGDVVRVTWFVLNGIGQAGGLAVAVEGLLLRTGGEAPSSGPLSPRPSPAAPPEASPPAEPGDGKPLFFLPMPSVVGRDGVGVGWGGVF